jgi:protein-L-isoaspartate(D-aspartate) O-methyltransferase
MTRVDQAMAELRRQDFLPDEVRRYAGFDRPLSIGAGQTTSQPSLIARMVQELELTPRSRVLEVGTGSGYQTALLARLCAEVFSVEIVEPLGLEARSRLRNLGYDNAHVRIGDGYAGWPEEAPFDGIVICAATPRVPPPLVEQLAVGGRLVLPLAEGIEETLVVLQKNADGTLSRREVTPVRFVPLTGPLAENDRLT